MSEFVNCLRDPRLQESMRTAKAGEKIMLPKGVIWLGNSATFSNELFVRACYSELVEAKEEYFKLSNGKLQGVVYTGTSGIGKSHLCALVVAQELIAGKVVYFEVVSSSIEQTRTAKFYRLELASGAFSLDSLQELEFLTTNANAVYIVHGGPTSSDSPLQRSRFLLVPQNRYTDLRPNLKACCI
jgi:hypothetical protein